LDLSGLVLPDVGFCLVLFGRWILVLVFLDVAGFQKGSWLLVFRKDLLGFSVGFPAWDIVVIVTRIQSCHSRKGLLEAFDKEERSFDK
jgi:hypothetical protein